MKNCTLAKNGQGFPGSFFTLFYTGCCGFGETALIDGLMFKKTNHKNCKHKKESVGGLSLPHQNIIMKDLTQFFPRGLTYRQSILAL